MPHPNNKNTNKTKIQTQSLADRITTSLSLHQRKNKNSAQISPYTKLTTNHWTNLRRAETKRKKEFNLLQGKNSTFFEAWEKETSNTITLYQMKRWRNTAQMKEQTRNTEVQIMKRK